MRQEQTPHPGSSPITLMIQELSLKRVGFRDESMSQFLVMERKRYDAVHLHITSSKVLWLSLMACTHTHIHTHTHLFLETIGTKMFIWMP